MKLALIQGPLVWEDPEANRKYFSERISSLDDEVDLIILPEMFSSAFTMSPQNVAETMCGQTIVWMKDTAAQYNAALTGSVVIKDEIGFYNRMLFITPSGEIRFYDKRHLFSLTGEDKAYIKGQEKVIIAYQGWNICLQVCYDLRFPVFSRNDNEYDLLIYCANWPAARITAWDALLRARAIENMSFVAGVNRIGNDKNDYDYPGHSQVIDMLGNYISKPLENETILLAELNKIELDNARAKFGFLKDRDRFTVLN